VRAAVLRVRRYCSRAALAAGRRAILSCFHLDVVDTRLTVFMAGSSASDARSTAQQESATVEHTTPQDGSQTHAAVALEIGTVSLHPTRASSSHAARPAIVKAAGSSQALLEPSVAALYSVSGLSIFISAGSTLGAEHSTLHVVRRWKCTVRLDVCSAAASAKQHLQIRTTCSALMAHLCVPSLHVLLALTTPVTEYVRFATHRKLRPQIPVARDPSAWWRHAVLEVLQESRAAKQQAQASRQVAALRKVGRRAQSAPRGLAESLLLDATFSLECSRLALALTCPEQTVNFELHHLSANLSVSRRIGGALATNGDCSCSTLMVHKPRDTTHAHSGDHTAARGVLEEHGERYLISPAAGERAVSNFLQISLVTDATSVRSLRSRVPALSCELLIRGPLVCVTC